MSLPNDADISHFKHNALRVEVIYRTTPCLSQQALLNSHSYGSARTDLLSEFIARSRWLHRILSFLLSLDLSAAFPPVDSAPADERQHH
jgi:hypothetical protein